MVDKDYRYWSMEQRAIGLVICLLFKNCNSPRN